MARAGIKSIVSLQFAILWSFALHGIYRPLPQVDALTGSCRHLTVSRSAPSA
jgi:hypothetical protein